MSYCRSCGKEIESSAAICPFCGVPQKRPTAGVVDTGGFLWGLLGFCVPLAGLIIFLIWKEERPMTAKAAGMGALISVIISVVTYIIMFIVVGSLGAFAY